MQGQSVKDRLNQLRRRDNPGVAPFWVAALASGEALEAAKRFDHPWARLVEARTYMDQGRTGQAARVLEAQNDLPPGLAAIRLELLKRLEQAHDATPAQGREREEVLSQWLDRVRGWRSGEKS